MAGVTLRLHDDFIAGSIARLRPGGIALFVTSTGPMTQPDTNAWPLGEILFSPIEIAIASSTAAPR